MAKSYNLKRKGVDSIVQYQQRDQIWSITFDGKEDLIDAKIGGHVQKGAGNDLYLTLNSDFRKENVIDTVVNPANGGTSGIALQISHGANNTESHSTLTLNVASLNAVLDDILARLGALETA